MEKLFVQYPRCGTCKKAKNWLDNNNIDYNDRHIVENNPTKEELREWYEKSGLPLKKFFNTSGVLYRELGIKDKVKTANEDELLEILATNGMLVKRPILVGEDFVLVGFKEEEWKERLNK